MGEGETWQHKNLKSLKFSDLAISEMEAIQTDARKALADEKNVEKYDEIFPIFKNSSAIMCVAVLEFINKWWQVKASDSPAKVKARREVIIKLLKKVRRKGWLSNEIRGYNLE